MVEPFDIAVIGAGPAGTNSALAAAQKGKSVILLDEQARAGGQVWRAKDPSILAAPDTPESTAGRGLRDDLAESAVTHLGNTRVWHIEREAEMWRIHCLRDGRVETISAVTLILATGAREYVQPIPGWTTPGVIGLAGATALFKQSLTLPGQNTVVAGTGPLVFFVASEIRRLGGKVAAVVTPNTRKDWLSALPAMMMRPDLLRRGAIWVADLMINRVPIHWGSALTEVHGGTGVKSVDISKLSRDWSPRGQRQRLTTDSVCLGNGLIPATQAAQLVGLSISHQPMLGGWVPKMGLDGATDQKALFICGDGGGIRGVAAAELHGTLTGLNAAQFLGTDTTAERAALRPRYNRAARFGLAMTAMSVPRAGLMQLTSPQTIVCRCESLTCATISQEVASGAGSTNAVKSGLRAGMGPCGGKFCQTAIARLIAGTEGKTDAQIPPPTPRPPLRPVPVDAVAGDFDYNDLPIPKPAPL